ncbi:MAG: Tol-Pal system beta propeller repeat protein TolB [Candidatus Abyssubacteria bacterium]
MMRHLMVFITAVTVLLSCPVASFGQSDVVIDVYGGIAKVKIGIPPLARDPSAVFAQPVGVEFIQVLRDDLDFTGLFQVYNSPPLNAVPAAGSQYPPLKAWVPLDVQAVVQGSYSQSGGKAVFECALFDVESETRIVGRVYRGSPEEIRSIAHRFADEIVYRYTGQRGISHTSIAYVKSKGGHKEIYVMDYDGHNSYRLTYDNSIALSPEWSPDGKKITFTSYKDRNPDVYIADLEKKSYVRVSGYIGLNTTPSFSPDGKTLALTLSKDGNPELYLLGLATGRLTRLTRNSSVDTSPTWSPNGREIAFVSDRSGSPQIYIVDREGVNLRRITYSGSYNTSPAWSPQGDKIAFHSTMGGGGDIYTISPTGGNLQRLTFNGGNEDPAWSPDGKFLTFSSRQGGQRDIYLMRSDGSGRRQVTFGGGDNMSPAWSP